jgi:hypothetical protein
MSDSSIVARNDLDLSIRKFYLNDYSRFNYHLNVNAEAS